MMNIATTVDVIEPPAPADSGGVNPESIKLWSSILRRGIHPATALSHIELPSREAVLGQWFRQGDLGFIYGPRGLGKTWLALHLARQIAEGGRVASWAAQRPRRVLYIDGEMPLDGLRERDAALSGGDTAGMLYLQHEALFQTTGAVLNLADPAIQAAVSELCATEKIEVLVLDNLSCLFRGVAENDANEWEKVLPWLLDLRRNRIAVVFVAHAGRNGLIRGTSRREDAAFWILQLSAPDSTSDEAEGARFIARFDKNRNSTEDECPVVEWSFRRGKGGRADVVWKMVDGLDKLRYWVSQGLTNPTDIAMEMGVTKGRISQLAKIAIERGWLKKEGREYFLVDANHGASAAVIKDAKEQESLFNAVAEVDQ